MTRKLKLFSFMQQRWRKREEEREGGREGDTVLTKADQSQKPSILSLRSTDRGRTRTQNNDRPAP